MSPAEGAPATIGELLFLVDPAAGSGRTLRRLASLLDRHPIAPRAARTADIAERAPLLANLDPLTTAVIAVGGDGTVAAVAASVLADGRDIIVGVLPLGTGNAFAHGFGIRSPRQALDVIAAGAVRRVDVMRTDRTDAPVALVSLSTGFEGALIERYGRTRRYGRVAAAWYAVGAAASRGTGMSLTVDGYPLLDERERAFSAGAYNMPTYAFGLTPWPGSDPTDGRVIAAVAPDRRAWLRLLRGDPRGCRVRTGSIIRLESTLPLQVDGDAVPPGTITAHVQRRALCVLAP